VDGEPAASDEEALVQAACQLAARLPAAVIVTVTHSGETARLVAKYRPAQPILAPTGAPEVYRRLALVRDVTPLLLPGAADDLEATLDGVRGAARRYGWEGKAAVFVARDRLWKGVL
jgi:pyruvate kinase